MKLFGKEEQKKTLQIELLQKKIGDLELEQTHTKKAFQKLKASAAKEKENAAVAFANLEQALRQERQELASVKEALDVSKNAAAKSLQKLEASAAKDKENSVIALAKLEQSLREDRLELTAVKEALAVANNTNAEANQQIESLQYKTAEVEAQLVATQKLCVEAQEENELLLHQLMQVQEELEKIFLEKRQFEAELLTTQADLGVASENHRLELDQLQANLNQLNVIKETLQGEVISTQQELALSRAEKQATEAALTELQAKTPRELKAVNDKYQELAMATQAAEVELERCKSELEQTKQNAAQLSIELAQVTEGKSSLETLQVNIQSMLEETQAQLTQQAENFNVKLKDSLQENELLLTQLMQVQEELESYYLDKTKFEKLYQDIQARWLRLARRLPGYVDFGSVEIVAFDHLSDVPSITWKVKDFAQGGVFFNEFLFQTVLQDGQPGIGLVDDVNANAIVDSALVPKLIKPKSKQLERFVRMGRSEFRQLVAAAAIMSQVEATAWRDLAVPKDFDPGFWRPLLKMLPSQFQVLPVLLRYDQVKLKRELVNPDYEHLWLEFKGLGLGAREIPKFEIRLAAAMVQPGGFSQFPKLEIPLVDGKTKPFESWYAESQDDHGPKLELRFSLEKKVFDARVWARLEEIDRALMLRLVYAMPDALMHLESQQVAINRPWATWISFARGAVQVIELSRTAAAQIKELPKPDSKIADETTVSTATNKQPASILLATTKKKSSSKSSLTNATNNIKPDSKPSVTIKKPAAKKPAAKKPAAKKPAAKKPAAKKPAAKKPAAKKPAAKKPRSQEAKKPRSQEAKKPRSQEAKKPRSQEAKKPAAKTHK